MNVQKSLPKQQKIILSLNGHRPVGMPRSREQLKLVNPEGQEINPEVEVQQPGHEEPEEEIECPNHEPASFMKGKPRSILSLQF